VAPAPQIPAITLCGSVLQLPCLLAGAFLNFRHILRVPPGSIH
jgi:hypothetical protein